MDSIQTNKKEYNVPANTPNHDECICLTTPYTVCTLM